MLWAIPIMLALVLVAEVLITLMGDLRRRGADDVEDYLRSRAHHPAGRKLFKRLRDSA